MSSNNWIRKKIADFDWGVFFLIIVLFSVGLVALNSATAQSGESYLRNNFHKQIVWGLIGATAMFSIFFIQKRIMFEWSYIIYGATLLLLVLTLFFGTGAGSSRWFRLGMFQLNAVIEQVMENLHRLAIDLRPASLDHLGLEAALRQHCTLTSATHDLSVQIEAPHWEGRLSPEVEVAL